MERFTVGLLSISSAKIRNVSANKCDKNNKRVTKSSFSCDNS